MSSHTDGLSVTEFYDDDGESPRLKKAAKKQHICPLCGRSFARREHVERHERSHTKEQPFRCHAQDCHRAFTRRDLLTRHSRLAHASAPASNDDEVATNTINTTVVNRDINDPYASVPDFFDDALADGLSFLDGNLDLPSHPWSPSYQPLPPLPEETWQPFLATPAQDSTLSSLVLPDGIAGALSTYSSRLPSLEAEQRPTPNVSTKSTHRLRASVQCIESMKSQLASFLSVLPAGWTVPSRHTLDRYLNGYLRGFHRHYPILHVPTLALETLPVELLLAIASLGAQYCLERSAGFRLFYLAKPVVLERLRRQRTAHNGDPDSIGDDTPEASSVLHTIHTLLLLIAVSMWSKDVPPFHEALSLRVMLERLIKTAALEDGDESQTDELTKWVRVESIQRAKVIVFCFFNLQTMVFDVPPMILAQNVDATLPCSEQAWEASTADDWSGYHNITTPKLSFQEAYDALFATPEKHEGCLTFSSLGGHGLIHAVIQRIWLLQQAARLPNKHGTLSHGDIFQLERVLKRWQRAWEHDAEASVTPVDGHGPLSFTSTALLRLAYIRINMDLGTVPGSMSSWDPEWIATNFAGLPTIERGVRATRAALHCAHGFSIPIRLGIDFVARTQVFFWSNQYALCSLESALFLTKWLESVGVPNDDQGIATEEAKVLNFLVEMVAETDYGPDAAGLLARTSRLSAAVLRLWAKLFREDSVWEIVGLIGRSLLAYAHLLERTESHQGTDSNPVSMDATDLMLVAHPTE